MFRTVTAAIVLTTLLLALRAVPSGAAPRVDAPAIPLALTQTAEPPTLTPVPPTQVPTEVPTEAPTFTPLPSQDDDDREERTPETAETPVLPAGGPTETPTIAPAETPTATTTPVPAPQTLPSTGSLANEMAPIFWLALALIAIGLSGLIPRRRMK